MKTSYIIKNIRDILGMSQTELAEQLGVSFATVNRWENGRCEPSKIAIQAMKQLCSQREIDYSQFEGASTIEVDEIVTLYHGSKSGIQGDIAPVSRDRCDFGKGFYMGTDRMQPLPLICNHEHAKLYTLKANLSGLKILDLELGLDWAMLIAFYRGKMDDMEGSAVYTRFQNLTKGCDMIVGYIADDRMFTVLDRFFRGDITDAALIQSLSALKLGKQYVAVSKRACSQIEIICEEFLSAESRESLKMESLKNRELGISLADEICKQYRREGRYFDEILKAGE